MKGYALDLAVCVDPVAGQHELHRAGGPELVFAEQLVCGQDVVQHEAGDGQPGRCLALLPRHHVPPQPRVAVQEQSADVRLLFTCS